MAKQLLVMSIEEARERCRKLPVAEVQPDLLEPGVWGPANYAEYLGTHMGSGMTVVVQG